MLPEEFMSQLRIKGQVGLLQVKREQGTDSGKSLGTRDQGAFMGLWVSKVGSKFL